MIKLIKRQSAEEIEPVITIEYSTWSDELESISNLIESKQSYIVGFGENKEMYQIKIDNILYFEAVGELVFAYTKKNVYEIKQRLYQIEEKVRPNHILRASKSVLLNVYKITEISPALNGRMYATFANGEQVLISRNYAKAVTEVIRGA